MCNGDWGGALPSAPSPVITGAPPHPSPYPAVVERRELPQDPLLQMQPFPQLPAVVPHRHFPPSPRSRRLLRPDRRSVRSLRPRGEANPRSRR